VLMHLAPWSKPLLVPPFGHFHRFGTGGLSTTADLQSQAAVSALDPTESRGAVGQPVVVFGFCCDEAVTLYCLPERATSPWPPSSARRATALLRLPRDCGQLGAT